MESPAPLFVVSDVHGHRADLVDGLRAAGLLDRREAWCGAAARLWVLGDLTDRGPDGIGVLDLVRALQQQASGRVHVLMGNHEILALGRYRFPRSGFADAWVLNGGLARDQEALTAAHADWLGELPVMGRVGPYLLAHSDTTAYLGWGESVEQVNATVRQVVAAGQVAGHWEVWKRLTSRYHFMGTEGPDVARGMLATYGGDRIVHGHSIIATLSDTAPEQTSEPLTYADGLALAVDGGRYAGGPLLVVRLQ